MVSNWPIERELFFFARKKRKKAMIDKKENCHQITKRFFLHVDSKGSKFHFWRENFSKQFLGVST